MWLLRHSTDPGRHVSVPMEQLIAEAEGLARQGVKELIVIAQDTTYYGMDLYGERKLGELLHRLCRIDGIEWIRLHYAYPTHFPEQVIEAMRDEPKICKYLDIPFQHISDSQLKSMRRGLNKSETYALIEKLRREIPDIALRTTLLTGYPGRQRQTLKSCCNSYVTSVSNGSVYFPTARRRGPIQQLSCMTMFQRR